MSHQSATSSHEPQQSSLEEVYKVICAATSQDPAQMQSSAKRLKELLDMTMAVRNSARACKACLHPLSLPLAYSGGHGCTLFTSWFFLLRLT